VSQGNGTAGTVRNVAASTEMEVSDVDASCAEEIAPQKNIQRTKVIRIRLYEQPRAWSAIRESNFSCGISGELDLEKVGKELGLEGACRMRSRPILQGITQRASHFLDN
jgi:hypothetical protein